MSQRTDLRPKESRLSIRASDAEKAILAQAARARRMNTSQFVLKSSLDAEQSVLSERDIRHARMRQLAAEAMNGPSFVADMRGTMEEFRHVDSETWHSVTRCGPSTKNG